jgi:hypothetical protein
VTEAESVITDERMIFSISQDQTTLYDQIEYSGAPFGLLRGSCRSRAP